MLLGVGDSTPWLGVKGTACHTNGRSISRQYGDKIERNLRSTHRLKYGEHQPGVAWTQMESPGSQG